MGGRNHNFTGPNLDRFSTPHFDHISTTFRPHFDRISTAFRPHFDHIPTTLFRGWFSRYGSSRDGTKTKLGGRLVVLCYGSARGWLCYGSAGGWPLLRVRWGLVSVRVRRGSARGSFGFGKGGLLEKGSFQKSGVAPLQTKPKKGPKRKVHEFRPFCEFWCFSLGKQTRFTLNFVPECPCEKFMN